MSQDVVSVYRSVIDEVVTKCRPEFVQEGVDEVVLDDLRVLWEEKLQQSGALGEDKPAQQTSASGLPYQQQPYGVAPGQPAGYPTGSYQGYRPLGQPSPYQQPGVPLAYQNATRAPYQQTPVQQGQPMQALGQAPTQYSRPPPAHSNPPQLPQLRPVQLYGQPGGQYGQPSTSYGMPAQSQTQPGQPLGQPARQYGQPQAAYGAQRLGTPVSQSGNAMTQLPGTSGVLGQPPGSYANQVAQQSVSATALGYQSHAGAQLAAGNGSQSNQLTGSQIQEDLTRKRKAHEELAHAQKQQYMARAPAGQALPPTQIPQQDGPADDGKEDDGDDNAKEAVDNLSDVASDDEDEEEVSNQCISQFTKVQRTKTRWKCQLKAGVLHLSGRDYVFNTATGEMQF